MGSLSGKIASNGLTPTYVNSATNASPGKLYQCDTSSAAFTVTLPTGSSGSVLRFVDDKGTWATNNLTIAPAATQTIQGISGNGSLVCDLSGAYVEMTWDATNSQWCVQTTGFQYGPPLSASQAGTMPASNISLDNGSATRLGLKQYLHGGSYSGGGAPTITLSSGGGTLSSVTRGIFVPYQMQDGTWRLKVSFTVFLSSAARTSAVFAINGVTFNIVAGFDQIGSGLTNVSQFVNAYTLPNTSTVEMDYPSSTTTLHSFSGDFELASKPTWAY